MEGPHPAPMDGTQVGTVKNLLGIQVHRFPIHRGHRQIAAQLQGYLLALVIDEGVVGNTIGDTKLVTLEIGEKVVERLVGTPRKK